MYVQIKISPYLIFYLSGIINQISIDERGDVLNPDTLVLNFMDDNGVYTLVGLGALLFFHFYFFHLLLLFTKFVMRITPTIAL